MVLTVLIAAVFVGRWTAAPLLAMTWALPVAVTRGLGLSAAFDAFLAAVVIALVGVGLRVAYDALRSSWNTARA